MIYIRVTLQGEISWKLELIHSTTLRNSVKDRQLTKRRINIVEAK